MAAALDSRAGVSACCGRGHTGYGSGQSGRPGYQYSFKQTGPRGREVRTDGMAHETHAKSLPADLGAPAFVDGWMTRALVIGAIFSVVAVILALLGLGAGPAGMGSLPSRVAAGPDDDIRFLGWRAGSADGAVLFRRQVGPAAAPSAGGNEPDASAGFHLLVGHRILTQEALPVGQSGDGRRWSEARLDQRRAAGVHRARNQL